MKNNILQLHNQSERTVEKIDCPFSMPMSRKERPPMTKPREKTREELQAEIEGGGRRKSGSLKIGKRCCVRSYSKRNAERAATALSSGAQSLKALCRKQRT